MRRRSTLVLLPAAIALLGLSAAVSASATDNGGDRSSFEFSADLIGSTPTAQGGPTLFGVTPGTLPWVSTDSRARVSDGELRVELRGLVVPTAPQNGTNPVPNVSVSLVCNGKIAATSAAVPFSAAGDARIRQPIAVPSPCLAPAILVHPNTNLAAYIAANG